MKKKQKSVEHIVSRLMGAIVLAMLVVTACSMKDFSVSAIFEMIALLFIVIYGIWLYKKPHGNMLRDAILVFAAANLIAPAFDLAFSEGTVVFTQVIRLFCAGAVCFGAGRLQKIEQNKFLFPIVDGIFIVLAIIWIVNDRSENVLLTIRYLCTPITFTALTIAYFIRYKEHSEAGLEDKPKTK